MGNTWGSTAHRRLLIGTPTQRHTTVMRKPLVVALAGAIAVAAVVALIVGLLVASSSTGTKHGRSSDAGATSTTGSGSASASSPLDVVAVEVDEGSPGVPGGGRISVKFSSTLAADTPRPVLSPATPGKWLRDGVTMTFTPAVAYLPLTKVALVVPAGQTGMIAANGGHMTRGVVKDFQVENGSTLRLNQLLSLLRYSPLVWTPAAPALPSGDTAAQREALFRPPAGQFAWQKHGWPSQLTSLWDPDTYGVMTRGLVMSFQADHGLLPNGVIDMALWRALLHALGAGALNTGGYNYALANKAQPESLTVWHNGVVVAHVAANTGISASPTPDGNFPVYTRLRNQVMKGANPDGTKYADPVQYVAYFYHSDAVHYLARANYGIPQSLGCIELSLSDAAKVWPYLAYGTIVSVIN
ncbi:MAG: L,D-transpeptidase family protein [Acidimicrobiales bacterium]